MIRAIGFALVFLAFCGTMVAAETPMPPQRPRDTAPAPEVAPSPPYESKLDRLAELLGTLAFLRNLCGVDDGAVWRNKMTDLMNVEGATPLRRDRLAGAFNRGFEDYRISYRTCTPAAELVIERALTEGAGLTHELSARFGN